MTRLPPDAAAEVARIKADLAARGAIGLYYHLFPGDPDASAYWDRIYERERPPAPYETTAHERTAVEQSQPQARTAARGNRR